MVGLGRRPRRHRRLRRRTTTSAPRVLLRALAARGFAGRLVLASSMVVYGEGRYRCARARRRAPGAARAPPTSTRAASSRRARVCGRAARRPRPSPEDAPLDPRNVYAATKLAPGAPVRGVRARDRRAGHRAALPQRLRAADAARHARTPAWRAIFRSRAGRRASAPRVFEDGGQRRDFVHVRDVARANVLALDAPSRSPGAFNVASGTPRTRARHGARARPRGRRRAPSRWSPASGARGDVRHVFASPERAAERARLPRARGLRGRDGRVRRGTSDELAARRRQASAKPTRP